MEPITAVCAKAAGHEDLVPCRICTAFVPRSHLDGGLLPEETHHDEAALMEFFEFETQRRMDRQREAAEEVMQLRIDAYRARVNQGSSNVPPGIRMKPAAVVTRTKDVHKKPAAADGRRKRKVTIAKKPSRA